MGKIIKVAPQQLKDTAMNINSYADSFEDIYKNLLQCASNMGSAWEGEDNLAYVEKINQLATKLNAMTEKLRVGSNALKQQAENYENRRNDNIAKINRIN